MRVRRRSIAAWGFCALLMSCANHGPSEDSQSAATPQTSANGTAGESVPPLAFTDDIERGLATAVADNRPVILAFLADWDMHSMELLRNTFADAQLVAAHGRFVGVRVDATDDEVPRVHAALMKFNVKGAPTVLILDSSGKEMKRVERFMEAKELSAILATVP